MATKLYVGNLSYSTTEDALESLFSEAGTVTSVQVITDKFSGQSRGFGFVEMATESDAQHAIATRAWQNARWTNADGQRIAPA